MKITDIKLGRILVIFEAIVLAGLVVLIVAFLFAGKYWIGLPVVFPLILPELLSVGSSLHISYVAWVLYFLVWLLVPIVSIVLNRKRYLILNIVMLVLTVAYPIAFYYMVTHLP